MIRQQFSRSPALNMKHFAPRSSAATLSLKAAGALLACCVFSAGCAVGPNKGAPEIKTGDAHRGETQAEKASFADLPWWKVYRDPTLFRLIRTATSNAYDLRIAMARVEVARQAHRAAVWSLWPTIGVQGGVGDQVGTPTVPGLYPPQSADGHWGLGAGASWEPDVWGRLRRTTSAALHDFEATDEDRRGVYMTLVGDVAELYFELLGYDMQQAFTAKAVEVRKDTLLLFQDRARGGVGNDLEVSRALASLKQAEAAVTKISLVTATTENALSYLLARLPSPIERGVALAALEFLPAIPAGLPSTLLRRRPDIRAAEKRLLAQNDKIGAEMADFFPKFQLTGFVGLTSPDLAEASVVRGGAGLFKWTLPFLGGERERAEYDAARAAWEGSVADYERTCGNAFREVANSLAGVATLKQRRAALEEQVSALQDAQKHAMDRYRGGVANYLDVLTAQEQLLAVELEISDVMSKQHGAVARLYRSLGGGWPLPEKEAE